ncbi:hypothetical protein GM415_03320 [Pseudodesulfovibrio cashew]|uniref:PilZ domain-containing protein n=1 Tax=Pseudodesulfovibrio cashew TaxID=2678688 RepID=A0A6I6JF82_9BACT|nr:PilZ domain-containing protein [Pseudodesulfovibrio cashew]QGY39193.1 hypothetical protein GM415_03320 [Pseudodesulfovibrio cashew]
MFTVPKGWADMSEMRRICFDISRDDEKSLEYLATEEGMDVPEYLRSLVSRYLFDLQVGAGSPDFSEKREFPRKQVSILGVSCVRFSDNEMRSYPVIVEDISEGGLRISFRSVDSVLAEKLAFADYFEVVFTVPETTHTVSFYCKRMWASSQTSLNLAGCFEGANDMSVDLVSRMIIEAA